MSQIYEGRSLADLMTYGDAAAHSLRRQRKVLEAHRRRLASIAYKSAPKYCHYCHKAVYINHPDVEKRRTKDHIVPRSRGGQDRSWNIVDSCRACNSIKDSDLPSCPCSTCSMAINNHFDFIIDRAQGDELIEWSYTRKIEGLLRR